MMVSQLAGCMLLLLLLSVAGSHSTFWPKSGNTQSYQLPAIDFSLKPTTNEDSSALDVVQEVCYGDLGCFSTAEPWSSFGRIAFLPEKPQEINTQFLLYTRKNANEAVNLRADDVAALAHSHFNSTKKTKLIVHGFFDWGTHDWLIGMAQQILIQEDANVFCVDWRGGSQTFYAQATANTRVVGAEIANMVKFLSVQTGLNMEDVHIIGHSLGAHIAGYAGAGLQYLGRITGMDPADPYFQNMDPMVRLDESDALFVEVMHTDAGSILQTLLLQGGFGTWQPSGHVDVYINGGVKQPGCNEGSSSIQALIGEGVMNGLRYIVACPHCRAYTYMTETISSSCPWRSYKCSDWKEFKTGRCLRCPSDGRNTTCNGVGYRAVKPADGSANNIYWIATGDKSPFCRYHYHVQMVTSPADNKEHDGKIWLRLVGDNESTGLGHYYLATEESIVIKPSSTYDFLVTSANDLGPKIRGVEVKWEYDGAWYDIRQWQLWVPTIFLSKVSVFSGEHQTETTFCETTSEAFESKSSRLLSTQC